ncbi:MAG: peptidylprolyl isomerase [Paraclostridium sp.]
MDKENKNLNDENQNDKPKKSKAIWIATALSLLIGLGSGYYVGRESGRELPATSRKYSDNKVIATVGDVDLKEKELKQRMEPMFYMNGKTKMTDEQIDYYEQNMIDYITTTEVLYQEGVKQKVEVSKEDIDGKYQSLMASIVQTFQMEEEAFLDEFKISAEEVKKSLEREMIASKYIEQESQVSDEDAKSYYNKNKDEFEQVQASHILIKTIDENGEPLSDDAKKEAKELAEDVLKKALEGEDFAELAKKYSEDASSVSGGDLGFFGRGQMVAEFEESSFKLNKGQIESELVETQYGYHIIKKIDEKIQSLDEVKDSLKEQLTLDKQDSTVDRLMKEYNVEVK